MTNKEKVIEIFRLLEKNHINLYHDISKEEFEIELNKFLEIANDLDGVHFDAGMSKLFSLFKDAHTLYWVKDNYVQGHIKYIDNKFYLCNRSQKFCEQIKKINGFDIGEVATKLAEQISYEVEPWLNHQLTFEMRGLKHLKMIDCGRDDNQIEYTLKSGEIVTRTLSNVKGQSKPIYSFEELDNNILKVDYKSCRDIEKYPFKQFVDDIKAKYKVLPSACLIDLRYNAGGNDMIIFPLLDWLEENKIKTYALMNGAVFSSGVFALIDLKHRLNATLIGTTAGQAAHCYGQCRWLKVDEQEFSYCERYFNQTTIDTHQKVKEYPIKKVINYLEPIKPDIYLEERIEDIKLGIDGQLNDSIEIILKDLELSTDKIV